MWGAGCGCAGGGRGMQPVPPPSIARRYGRGWKPGADSPKSEQKAGSTSQGNGLPRAAGGPRNDVRGAAGCGCAGGRCGGSISTPGGRGRPPLRGRREDREGRMDAQERRERSFGSASREIGEWHLPMNRGGQKEGLPRRLRLLAMTCGGRLSADSPGVGAEAAFPRRAAEGVRPYEGDG